jgi:prophage maintenance system killer protein
VFDEILELHTDHPFLDGNKRTGGLELPADEDEVVALVIGIAAGNVSKTRATVFIERCCRPRRA